MAKVPSDQHTFTTYSTLNTRGVRRLRDLSKGVVMMKNMQNFPSGRSIERCRQDAKALVKQSKQTNAPIHLNTALDIVASQNGINLPWAKAINQLKQVALKKTKVAQMHLLGHALNLLIDKDLINMSSTDDAEASHLECKLLNQLTIIIWSYVGYGEVRLSVWWNFDKTKHPQHLEGGFKNKVILDNLQEHERMKYYGTKKGIFSNSNSVEKYEGSDPLARHSKYREFVGVLCSTWIERKNGKYLQTEGGKRIFDSYVRAKDKNTLCTIPDCKPNGFSLDGRFHF